MALLPDRDTVRSRGRRRRSSTDLGEGCSYSPIAEIGSPSKTQDGSTDGSDINIQCTCNTSTSSTRYTRSNRRSYTPLLALSILASTSASLHASASPVDVMRNDIDRKGKGKGRAIDYDEDTSNTYLNAMNYISDSPHQSSLQHSRLGKRDLEIDSGLSPARQRQRRGQGQGGGQPSQQKSNPASRKSVKRSNTPDGVPSHYEYIDGAWVPSPDWSLNGQNGARHGSSSSSTDDHLDEDNNNSNDNGENGDGPSTRQNNAHPTSTTVTGNTSDADLALDDDEGLSTTTLGWAKTTNAILGVDIDTSLSDDGAMAATATASSGGTLASSNSLVTRSNMATFTTVSSPTPSSTATSTAPSTSSTGVTDTSSNTQAGAYDFSRDVPNGWVSDGRTAAYAVPVIIGMSVFLALVIFGLILVLLRMNKSRKKRRKAVLNGGLKLSEEGKIETRPGSPALSTRLRSSTDENGDNDAEGGGGMSTSVQRRIAPQDGNDEDEENKTTIRRRISRKWSPNLSNGSLLLRKRRKKIAQLFKRDNDEPIQEIIIPDDNEGTTNDGLDGHNDDESEVERISSRDTATAGLRRRSVSSGRATTNGDGLRPDDALSRVASNTSMRAEAQDDDRTYIRPPSLQVDNTAVTSTESNDSPTSPAQAQTGQQQHLRNDSIDDGDHHAVPIPSIGPPAYMQPSTPAYSRAPAPSSLSAMQGSSSSGHFSSSGSNAIPASGYLSAVSTPGLLTAGMDEKRALLGAAGNAGGAMNDDDAFANQRRFEHLYNSREGEDDRIEQMTGAPVFANSSAFTGSSSSSSSRQHNANVNDEGNSDEAIARRAQEEFIEDHRRELQESLIGHVAISDKEVLRRLRMNASAPSTVLTDDGTVSTFENSSASSPSLSLPFGHAQEASAPSLDEAEDDELQSYLATSNVNPTSSSTSSGAIGSSMLPAPPKPFASTLHQLPPVVDEKTRLRQAEERQMASSFSPIFNEPATHPSRPDDDELAMSPSAPPAFMNAPIDASAPSAPAFDEDASEYVPSAPPMDVSNEPSAPSCVLEEDEEEEEQSSRDLESRPYHEGVV